jgi:hypothetical protein
LARRDVGHCTDRYHRTRGQLHPGVLRPGQKIHLTLLRLIELGFGNADQRVAAAQVVVQERKRRAQREAVEPQGHLG